MQNEKLQINLGEGVLKAELIVREVNSVNELPVKAPIEVALRGTIGAPFEFLTKRKDRLSDGMIFLQIKEHLCHVLVNREKKTITLVINENDEYQRGDVIGSLEEHPKFKEFGINSGKKWAPIELGQFIKMNRAFFVDKNINMKLVTELKNFVANINSKIEKEKNENGSFKDNFSGIVSSNLPGSFKANIPLFRGNVPEEIEVEFYASVNGRDIELQLYSPGAAEAMEKIRDEVIDTEVEKIRDITPGIAIIEQ